MALVESDVLKKIEIKGITATLVIHSVPVSEHELPDGVSQDDEDFDFEEYWRTYYTIFLEEEKKGLVNKEIPVSISYDKDHKNPVIEEEFEAVIRGIIEESDRGINNIAKSIVQHTQNKWNARAYIDD